MSRLYFPVQHFQGLAHLLRHQLSAPALGSASAVGHILNLRLLGVKLFVLADLRGGRVTGPPARCFRQVRNPIRQVRNPILLSFQRTRA